MRHRFGNAKLKRDVGARNSLLKNLTTSVILEERVITTIPKAKAVQPIVENMITLAKRDTLHTRRQAASFLCTPKSVQKLFDTLGPRYKGRAGGYSRVVKAGFRYGDAAPRAVIELIDRDTTVKGKGDKERVEHERAAAEAAGAAG